MQVEFDSADAAKVGAGRALVAGAGVMVAHDLVPPLRRAGGVVTALGRADLGITDRGQRVAAVEAHKARTRRTFLHPSTGSVFDGTATKQHAVDRPVAPRSAYGRTRAAADWAVRAPVPRVLIRCAPPRYAARGARTFVSTMVRLAGERSVTAFLDTRIRLPSR